jgi:transposase
MAAKQHLEKDSIWYNKISSSIRQTTITKDIHRLFKHCSQKRGNVTGYDVFKRISGTKIHVAVDCNSLPVSIVISSANNHDSTRLIDVMENLDYSLDDSAIHQIKEVYADKGYDTKSFREYLTSRCIKDCILHRNYKTKHHDNSNRYNYNKTRYVVERFFAWLKCGFHRIVIRYERIVGNYLAFINIASFLMYCRVLGWVANVVFNGGKTAL